MKHRIFKTYMLLLLLTGVTVFYQQCAPHEFSNIAAASDGQKVETVGDGTEDEQVQDPVAPTDETVKTPSCGRGRVHVCSNEELRLNKCAQVCHIPPGNPAQMKDMYKSMKWVERHLMGEHAERMPFRIGPCSEVGDDNDESEPGI